MARQSLMGERAGEADRALPAGGRESLFCPKSSKELLRARQREEVSGLEGRSL